MPRRGRNLQAPIFDGRRIDRDHCRDEQRRVGRPTGLLILMRLEPPTPRHLEVDLILEQHGWTAEQLFDGPPQPTPADHCVETRVVPAQVFASLTYPRISIQSPPATSIPP